MTTKGETAVETFLRDRKFIGNSDSDNDESLSYFKAIYAEPPQRASRKNFPRIMIRQINGPFEQRGVGDYTTVKQRALIQISVYIRVDNKPTWTFWDGTTIPAVRAGTKIAEHIAKLILTHALDIAEENDNEVCFDGAGDITQPPAPGIESLDNVDVYRTDLNTFWNVWL